MTCLRQFDPHTRKRLTRKSMRDPLGHETRFTFNDAGQQVSRTLPLGFGTDGVLGSGETANGTFVESFQYDADGRQTIHVSFEGIVTQFVYDDTAQGRGRLAQKQFFASLAQYNNGTGIPTEVWTFGFDVYGRTVSTLVSKNGQTVRTESMTYNNRGQLDTVSTSALVGGILTSMGQIHYDYDLFGRQILVSSGSAGFQPASSSDFENVVEYSHDAFGRIATVKVTERNNVIVDVKTTMVGNQPETTGYRYDIFGNLARQDNPDGSISTWQYDELSRLEMLTEYLPDETPEFLFNNPLLALYDYDLRADGKRTGVSETHWFDGLGHQARIDWQYDSVGRMIVETFDHFDNANDYTATYEFDLTGNRLKKSIDNGSNGSVDEVIAYIIDANDRLITENIDTGNNGSVDTTNSYVWTGTQQTLKTVSAVGSVSSVAQYSFDLQGRMSRVITETFNGSGQLARRESVTYEYGTDGIRVSALHEIDADANGIYESRIRTEYLVDAQNPTGYQQVLVERVVDANTNSEIRRVVYTLGNDVISQTTYTPAGPAAGETLVLHYDGHGSTRVLTDLTAAVATISGQRQLFVYDAYGNAIGFNTALAVTTLLYSGEQYDQRIAMQYLRARYYDALTGLLNSRDPFGGNTSDPQSLHKHAYVHGDPIQGIDPTGREFTSTGSLGSMSIRSSMTAFQARAFRYALSAAKFAGVGGGIYSAQVLKQRIRRVPPGLLALAKDYAVLAEAAYGEGDFIGRAGSIGWTHEKELINDRPEGYRAQIFTKNGQVVLAIAGTNFKEGSDWFNNASQVFGLDSPQYEQAIADAQFAMQNYGGSIHFVGHSLGGGIAAAAALVFNARATTFNAAGVHTSTVSRYGASLSNADTLINSYRVQGEILSTLQNISGLWSLAALPFTLFSPAYGVASLFMATVGFVLPNGVGRDFWLPSSGTDPFSRHVMAEVISGLERVEAWNE